MKHKCALIVYGYMKVYECVCAWYMYMCVWCYGCVHSVCRDICAWYVHVCTCIMYAYMYMHNVCMCVHLSVKVCSLYAHMEARSVYQVLPLLLSTLVFKMRVNILHVCLCSTSYVPGADGG